MDAIRGRTKDAEDRIQQLEDTQGPLDKEAIQRLKDEKRKLAADHQAKRKQLDTLAKAAKQAQKLQQDINKTRLSKGKTERRLGQLKAQKDALQPLDELKQKAAELNEHITEDMRIIEDENTAPSERTAARERLAVRNEELEMVNEEIEARERQRPLLERVKEIFKKYGWTLQAVVLAVGLVLGALALAGLNGLKAGTKAVGQGLKTIGQKLGSLLPGLIGSIVSYIFKAAGQVLSFLGEHAWLLILAVVAFFMVRLLKKRPTTVSTPTATSVFFTWCESTGSAACSCAGTAACVGASVAGGRGVVGFGAIPWASVACLWIGFEGWLFGGLILLGPPSISLSAVFFVP